jgi:lipid-binding SYLF domain-containing protein
MSVNKAATILFSSFLIFATAPLGHAQNNVSDKNITDKNDVEQVQTQLSDLGYNPGDATGMMSSDTQQAIREFQWFNDMPVTGNLDQSTRAAIDSQDRNVASAQLSHSSSSMVREKPAMHGQSTSNTSNDQYSDQNKTTKHHHESKVTGKSEKDGSERVTKAAEVLHDLSSTSDHKIPDEILQQAEGIAVIPHMLKGAFGIGGRYGKGVVTERTENGRWSSPAFIEVGGGSFGAQLGVESTDLVLVFTDRAALDKLAKGMDLKLGVDAGVAAGPVGRHGEAGVNANLKSAIYSYSRSKGLFAGVALDGAVLNIEKSMNEKVYGSSVDAKQILGGNVAANATVRPFMDELNNLVPAKRISQK